MNKDIAEKRLKATSARVLANHKNFGMGFPCDQTKDYVYTVWNGTSWTEGFWTGMNMLSYEFSREQKFIDLADCHTDYFKNRLYKKIAVEKHDLGFLYTLSCVAKYKVTGDITAKNTAIDAARLLTGRYREKGKFIQAWGSIDNPLQYRLIIDCMMNIPLLFWAHEETGDEMFYDIAKNHLDTTLKTAIRDDYTTHHTYFFDPETGEPRYGKTAQGYSDDSCWARGQSWAVYGLALAYKYTKDEKLIDLFNKVTDVFVDKLPDDFIPYWDMIFSDGSGEERDTSAAAIAVCGILEMNKYCPNEKYMNVADSIMNSLIQKYDISEKEGVNGLLSDSMYSKPAGDKPEANTWGDYFYMEALMRYYNPSWNIYW